MHHHLEIIMPPTDDILAAVAAIMKPFDEDPEISDGDEGNARNSCSFWDWYVVGGRWSGEKIECTPDPERKRLFSEGLSKQGVTVSVLTAGKRRLQPASQIAMVDALWNDFFPDAAVKVCPWFGHFNDQYKSQAHFPDVMSLEETPKSLAASHVIIAGPGWKGDGSIEARYMIQDKMWNGVSFVKSDWDGLITSAIAAHEDTLWHITPELVAKYRPQPDWLVVTVDYHS